MKPLILAALIAASPALALADTYHTVDWFMAHPTERAETLAGCQNNTGLWNQHPNCTNAATAKYNADANAWLANTPTFGKIDQGTIDNCRWQERAHVPQSAQDKALCAKAVGGTK